MINNMTENIIEYFIGNPEMLIIFIIYILIIESIYDNLIENEYINNINRIIRVSDNIIFRY